MSSLSRSILADDDHPVRVRRRATHSTLRTLLLGGFAVIVALWTAAGIDVLLRFREADQQLRGLTRRFLQTEEDLSTIRTGVFLGALDVRDSLLDTDGGLTEAYRVQAEEYRRSCLEALARIRAREGASDESSEFTDLAQEVTAFWATVVPVLDLAPPQRAAEARRILNERVIPKRELVVRIAQQFRLLNRSRFQEQQVGSSELYASARQRIWYSGGLTLLLTVLVAWLVMLYASSLERQVRTQIARDAQNTEDLRRLSVQLVGAQEDERRLIARELHDEVGQALTAVKMHLSRARRGAEPSQSLAMDEARSVADSALQSVRELSRLLHPPMLDDMGLPATLEWYLKGFAARTGIATGFTHTGMDARPAIEIETCLFRIVQEATTNITKYASASRCTVSLRRRHDMIVLVVDDNGVGFDVEQRMTNGEGLGLLGIRERASGFRGSFQVESGPERGTRLTVELPALPRSDAPATDARRDRGAAAGPPVVNEESRHAEDPAGR